MSGSLDVDDLLDAISKVLLWCFVLFFAVMCFWFGAVSLFGPLVYRIHSSLFHIDRETFALVNYCGMSLVKLIAFGFTLFPYIGIRLVLRARKRA